MLYQVGAAFVMAAVLMFMRTFGGYSTVMNVPFLKRFKPTLLISGLLASPWTYALGVLPFFIFVAAVIVVASGALTVLTYAGGHATLAEYLQIARNARTSELTIFCGSMTGASLGFLWYNAHPAEIFMGDVGSLGLGAALAIVAILIKQEILLLFIGGIFV